MSALAQFLAALIVGLAEKLTPFLVTYLRDRAARKQQLLADAQYARDMARIRELQDAATKK